LAIVDSASAISSSATVPSVSIPSNWDTSI
jgi:hypothetical protein